MVREVERSSAGQTKVFPVHHCGGGVHNPDDIFKVIKEAAK
jgi:hypothetical protein